MVDEICEEEEELETVKISENINVKYLPSLVKIIWSLKTDDEQVFETKDGTRLENIVYVTYQELEDIYTEWLHNRRG